MCVFVLKFVLLSKDISIFQYLQLFSQILQKFFDFRIFSFLRAPFCSNILLNHSYFERLNLNTILQHYTAVHSCLGRLSLGTILQHYTADHSCLGRSSLDTFTSSIRVVDIFLIVNRSDPISKESPCLGSASRFSRIYPAMV